MTLTFLDCQDHGNPLNGKLLLSLIDLERLFTTFTGREGFVFELVNEKKSKLKIGIADTVGCVQYSAINDEPPYMMALADADAPDDDIMFLLGGTLTPIAKKYCFPRGTIILIACVFFDFGVMSKRFTWESI
jgi:hypothetical protein